jgi:hypothetical protein
MTPKLTQVFLEKADLEVPAFKAWFRKSKVVDDLGQPAVVYHGTAAREDFEVFRQFNDIGHHFGTSQAANDRIVSKQRDDRYKDDPGRVYPVYLSIQKPLHLDDAGTWEPEGIARELLKNYERPTRLVNQGEISPDDYNNIAMKTDRQAKMSELVKVLKRLGYDGIRYRNSAEDPTSVSWIAFSPGQIKSTFNRGTWDPRRGSILE